MALSGVLKKDFHKTGVFTLQLEWSATQDIANNKSTVTVKTYLISNVSGGTISASATKDLKVNIDGTEYSHGVNVSLTEKQKKLLSTDTHVITHNADGTRKFNLGATLNIAVTLSGIYYASVSIPSTQITLNTIPRASSIASFPNFTIGNSFNITINRASTAFTHTLELKYGNVSVATRTGIGASTTFTLSTAEENILYNAMPNVTSGTVTMYCTTYNGSTKIGSTTSKTARASIGSSITPSFSTITHSEAVSSIASNFDRYIQGKSRLSLAITGAVAGKGASIKEYWIYVQGENYESRTATTGYLKWSGDLEIEAGVRDSRGREYTKTITVNVLAYTRPQINNFRVDRCNSDGSLNPAGQYAKVQISGEYKSLNNKNTILLKISSKARNVSNYILKKTDSPSPAFTLDYVVGTYELVKSYDFYAELIDFFERVYSSVVLGTAKTVLDLARTGIGAGKYHERGAVDAKGNIYTDSDVIIADQSVLAHLAQTAVDNVHGLAEAVIVESGSTDTGQYIRFGNGIQICWHRYVPDIKPTTQIGSTGIYRSEIEEWVFPKPFITGTGLVVHVETVYTNRWATLANSPTSTSVNYAFLSAGTGSSGSTSTTVAFAIGRWKA